MAIIKQYHKDTDTTYVYESTSYWDEEKKQSRSKRRVIGKLDPVTGEIIPTGKRGRRAKNTTASPSGDYTELARLYEESQARKQQCPQLPVPAQGHGRPVPESSPTLRGGNGNTHLQSSFCLPWMDVEQLSCHSDYCRKRLRTEEA